MSTHPCGRRSRKAPAHVRAFALSLGLLALPDVSAAQKTAPPADLANASLETLLNIEITSASRHEQPVRDAAAAVFVLTHEDIRRSGAVTIAEVLRLVPGMNVARVDAHRWAISARGFNYLFANKLLVLVDGRSIYNPFFSGVHWDVQDTPLEDIERIEIIRGPGAALWGVNAVNGVVNIITKRAGDTQGGEVRLGIGSEARAIGSVRYGGTLGSASYRVFAKGLDIDPSVTPAGQPGPDGWRTGRGGFRLDAGDRSGDTFMLQADLYAGRMGDQNQVPTFEPPFTRTVDEVFPVAGGDVLGQWDHRLANDSTFTLRGYFDRYARRPATHRSEVADTADIDAQHHVKLSRRHDVVYGGAARWVRLSGGAGDDEWFERNEAEYVLLSAFAQDEIALVPKRLRLTLGSKVEYGHESGPNVQPSARLLWAPSDRHAAWAAIARAVRTPSHSDLYLGARIATFPLATGGLGEVVFKGSPESLAETTEAYDAGYRIELSPRLSLDTAAYYYLYDRIGSVEDAGTSFTPVPVPHVVLTRQLANKNYGEVHGVETFATWSATSRWRLRGGYAWHAFRFRNRERELGPEEAYVFTSTPSHQIHLQSWLTLPGGVETDATVSRVGSIQRGGVPGYGRLDLRAAWRPVAHLELSLVGQNLLDARHTEFVGEVTGVTSTVVRRSGLLRAAWSF